MRPAREGRNKRRREPSPDAPADGEVPSTKSTQILPISCFSVSHSFVVCLKCESAIKASVQVVRNHCNVQHESSPPCSKDVESLLARAVESRANSLYAEPFNEAVVYPLVGCVKVWEGTYCSRCRRVRGEGAQCKDPSCNAYREPCSYQVLPVGKTGSRFVRVAPLREQDDEPVRNKKLGVPVFSLKSQVGRRGEDSNTQEKLWRLFSSYASQFRDLKGGALFNELRRSAYKRVEAAKLINGPGLLSIDGLVKVLDALVKWGRRVADAAPALLGGRLRHDKRVFVSGSDDGGPTDDWGGDEDSSEDIEEEGVGEDGHDEWTGSAAGDAGAAGDDYGGGIYGGRGGEPLNFDYGAGVGGGGAAQLAIAEAAAARQGQQQQSIEGVVYEAHVPSGYLQRMAHFILWMLKVVRTDGGGKLRQEMGDYFPPLADILLPQADQLWQDLQSTSDPETAKIPLLRFLVIVFTETVPYYPCEAEYTHLLTALVYDFLWEKDQGGNLPVNPHSIAEPVSVLIWTYGMLMLANFAMLSNGCNAAALISKANSWRTFGVFRNLQALAGNLSRVSGALPRAIHFLVLPTTTERGESCFYTECYGERVTYSMNTLRTLVLHVHNKVVQLTCELLNGSDDSTVDHDQLRHFPFELTGKLNAMADACVGSSLDFGQMPAFLQQGVTVELCRTVYLRLDWAPGKVDSTEGGRWRTKAAEMLKHLAVLMNLVAAPGRGTEMMRVTWRPSIHGTRNLFVTRESPTDPYHYHTHLESGKLNHSGRVSGVVQRTYSGVTSVAIMGALVVRCILSTYAQEKKIHDPEHLFVDSACRAHTGQSFCRFFRVVARETAQVNMNVRLHRHLYHAALYDSKQSEAMAKHLKLTDTFLNEVVHHTLGVAHRNPLVSMALTGVGVMSVAHSLQTGVRSYGRTTVDDSFVWFQKSMTTAWSLYWSSLLYPATYKKILPLLEEPEAPPEAPPEMTVTDVQKLVKETFRPEQNEAISHLLNDMDVYNRSPMGSGKTMTYLACALEGRRWVVVISPRKAVLDTVAEEAEAHGIPSRRVTEGGCAAFVSEISSHNLFNRQVAQTPILTLMTPDVAQGKFGSWLLNYLAKIASAQRHLRPTLFVFEEAHIYCETTEVPGPIAKVLTVLGEARRDPGGKFILNVVSATLDAATYRLFNDSIPAEKERISGALRQAVVGNVDLTRSKLDVSIRRCGTKTEAERTLKEEVGHRSWSKCIVIVPFVADVDEVVGTLSTLSRERGFELYSGTSEKPEGLQEFMVSDRTERSLLVATNVASCGVSVKGVNLSIIYGGQYALSQVVQTMGRAARSDDLPGRAVWIYREAVQDKIVRCTGSDAARRVSSVAIASTCFVAQVREQLRLFCDNVAGDQRSSLNCHVNSSTRCSLCDPNLRKPGGVRARTLRTQAGTRDNNNNNNDDDDDDDDKTDNSNNNNDDDNLINLDVEMSDGNDGGDDSEDNDEGEAVVESNGGNEASRDRNHSVHNDDEPSSEGDDDDDDEDDGKEEEDEDDDGGEERLESRRNFHSERSPRVLQPRKKRRRLSPSRPHENQEAPRTTLVAAARAMEQNGRMEEPQGLVDDPAHFSGGECASRPEASEARSQEGGGQWTGASGAGGGGRSSTGSSGVGDGTRQGGHEPYVPPSGGDSSSSGQDGALLVSRHQQPAARVLFAEPSQSGRSSTGPVASSLSGPATVSGSFGAEGQLGRVGVQARPSADIFSMRASFPPLGSDGGHVAPGVIVDVSYASSSSGGLCAAQGGVRYSAKEVLTQLSPRNCAICYLESGGTKRESHGTRAIFCSRFYFCRDCGERHPTGGRCGVGFPWKGACMTCARMNNGGSHCQTGSLNYNVFDAVVYALHAHGDLFTRWLTEGGMEGGYKDKGRTRRDHLMFLGSAGRLFLGKDQFARAFEFYCFCVNEVYNKEARQR